MNTPDLGELDGPMQDPITANFYVSLDSQDQPLPMAYRNLVKRTEQWPVTQATPEGPARLPKTARDMYALGFYAYDLAASSCTWALFAVEAALTQRLNKPKATRAEAIKLAEQQGLISGGAGDVLEAGRKLRNAFVHDGKQPTWTFATSVDIIRVSHQVVADLYPDTVVPQQP